MGFEPNERCPDDHYPAWLSNHLATTRSAMLVIRGSFRFLPKNAMVIANIQMSITTKLNEKESSRLKIAKGLICVSGNMSLEPPGGGVVIPTTITIIAPNGTRIKTSKRYNKIA